MAVKFIAETDTLEQFRTTFNELCAQDFGDKANLSKSVDFNNFFNLSIDEYKKKLEKYNKSKKYPNIDK